LAGRAVSVVDGPGGQWVFTLSSRP
jgi:hypothetical protein